MSVSLHHSKNLSEPLPYILKNSSIHAYNRKDGKSQIMRRQNIIKTIQQRNNYNIYSQSTTMNNILHSNCDLINQMNKKQNLKKCMHIPEKYLAKNKKYYRADAHMKTKQNIIKNDIENIIDKIAQEKEKNDYIIINLRKNQQKVNKYQINKYIGINAYDCIKAEQNHINSQCHIDLIKSQKSQKLRYLSQNEKQNQSIPINFNQVNFFAKNSLLTLEMKELKKQLRFYIQKMKNFYQKANNQTETINLSNKLNYDLKYKKISEKEDILNSKKQEINNFYKDYLRLSQQSYDFLEYYLKTNHQTSLSQNNSLINSQISEESSELLILKYNKEQIQKVLKSSDNKVILSVLRSNYKIFDKLYQPTQILNRLILSFNLNPLNDFQFLNQETFTRVRKLMLQKNTRKQAKQFFLKYLFLDNSKTNRNDLENVIMNILKKLLKIINQSTIDNLFQSFKNILWQLIKYYEPTEQTRLNQSKKQSKHGNFENILSQQNLTKIQSKQQDKNIVLKEQIKWVLNNDPIFIWDEFLELIFHI